MSLDKTSKNIKYLFIYCGNNPDRINHCWKDQSTGKTKDKSKKTKDKRQK